MSLLKFSLSVGRYVFVLFVSNRDWLSCLNSVVLIYFFSDLICWLIVFGVMCSFLVVFVKFR